MKINRNVLFLNLKLHFRISRSLKSIHLAKGLFGTLKEKRRDCKRRPRCCVACGHSYPDYQRSRRIKLHGSLIWLTVAWLVNPCLYQVHISGNPKAFDSVAWFKASQSRRGFSEFIKKKKNTAYPARAHTEAGKTQTKVGQVYIMQFKKLNEGENTQCFWYILKGLNNWGKTGWDTHE